MLRSQATGRATATVRAPLGAPLSAARASSGPVNIGEASRATGVSAKMIRHYEQIGLLPAAARTDSGYRQYADKDMHTLRFIRQARQLGFGIAQIGVLLDLWRDQGRPSAEVKALAQSHIAELDDRIDELQQMRATLARLSQACHGDHRPDCPILDGLAGVPRRGKANASARPVAHRKPKRQAKQPSKGTGSEDESIER